jgi:hypothetical protein
MLETIGRFERKYEYNHNKGMVYANLGISQAAQKKIDEGFANILKALDEDRGYLEDKPELVIFNNTLFRQTERLIVVNHLESQLDILTKGGETSPKAYDFLNSLSDPDQRIFFFRSIGWVEMPYFFVSDRSRVCDGCRCRIKVGESTVRHGRRYFHFKCYKLLYAYWRID